MLLTLLPLHLLLLHPLHPYPLYYELIHYSPDGQRPDGHRLDGRHPRLALNSSTPMAAAVSGDGEPFSSSGEVPGDSKQMDRAKRRYYRKRQRSMYGDSGLESYSGRRSDLVELKPEIVDFPRLHAREQELYFHDAFALPWEKDKYYRKVNKLEKKFFPEQSFDTAFVDLPAEVVQLRKKGKRTPKKERKWMRGLWFSLTKRRITDRRRRIGEAMFQRRRWRHFSSS